jgi:hypothetical protein
VGLGKVKGISCLSLEESFCSDINDCNCNDPCKDELFAFGECSVANDEGCNNVANIDYSSGVIVSASFLSTVIVAAVAIFSFA